MDRKVVVARIMGDGNFAFISEDRIVFAIDASAEELEGLLLEERAYLPDSPETCSASQSTVSLGIIPTFDCNLHCGYCYARGGDSREVLNLDVGKTAIRSVIQEMSSEHILDISLVGGGEPLLHMEIVDPLIAYAEKESPNGVKVGIVTNGTFGHSTLQWLVQNSVSVRVSFDGVMQSEQRPFLGGGSSHDLVTQNIKALLSEGVPLTVQSIVTNKGLDSLNDTVDLLHDLGVDSWKVEPVQGTVISRSGTRQEPDPLQFAKRLLDCIHYIANSGYSMKVDTGFFGRPSVSHYCGMSTGNRIITPEGLVTSCVEVARASDPYSNIVMTGRVANGKILLDVNRQQLLNSLHFSNQEGGCSKCEWRFICGGGCPMSNIWRGGYPPIRKSSFTCSVEHWLLPRLLLDIAEDPRIAEVVMDCYEVQRC